MYATLQEQRLALWEQVEERGRGWERKILPALDKS